MSKPIVVITGASAGIGAATARRFGKEGYRVVALARRLDKLQELQKEIGAHCSVEEVDVTSADQVKEVIERIEKKLGPIAILVNNAGAAFGIEPAQQCKLEDWKKCVDVNINGVLYCTHAVLPLMVQRNLGHIINLGSIAGHYAYPGGNVYGGTKAFLHQFSLNLRADLLGTKVRVSCIEPGLVGGSEFSVIRFRGDEKRAKGIYEQANALEVDDIAEVIYFCAAVPSRVNINTIEVMPVTQAPAALTVHRST